MSSTRDKEEPSLTRRIGIAIKELRRRKGLTQSELAAAVHRSQAAISMIESGDRTTRVNLDDLQRIGRVLGRRRLSRLIAFVENIPEPKVVIKEARDLLHKIRRPK